MTIKTSKGKTYTVAWIDGPTFINQQVLVQMDDDRRLPEIAAEFDGLEKIERFDENQGDKVFEGYTRLVNIMYSSNGKVVISLAKE